MGNSGSSDVTSTVAICPKSIHGGPDAGAAGVRSELTTRFRTVPFSLKRTWSAAKLTFEFAAPYNRNSLHQGSLLSLARSGAVVAIQVHDLVPCGRKVLHELLL